MILATDVQYAGDSALVAGVLFESWQSTEPFRCITRPIHGVASYEPGAFYKRELPCILSLLEGITEPLEAVVVDGFVTLGQEEKPGLGKHLYDALDGKIAVIGVAKKAFKDTPQATELFRGQSTKPLYVTSVGIDSREAMASIAAMHGEHRIPKLLKRADQLCRGITKP